MADQKFAIGQLVDFDTRNSPARRPTGPYEVVRVLPLEDGSFRSYRIKSMAEPFERIAKEYEIVAVEPSDAQAFAAKTMPPPAPRSMTAKRS
jgi:hypothetical protein